MTADDTISIVRFFTSKTAGFSLCVRFRKLISYYFLILLSAFAVASAVTFVAVTAIGASLNSFFIATVAGFAFGFATALATFICFFFRLVHFIK